MTPPADESTKAPPRVSVVVVSHDRIDSLRRCLTSIERSTYRDRLQVIVVENGSRDGSAGLDAEFPALQWIKLPKNFGLTKGWNLGWRAADAEYVLFLHDDTELDPGAISLLADTLDANNEAVAVCPLLVDESGKPSPQLGKFPPDGMWAPAQPSGTAPMPVSFPRGAAVMVRVFYIKAIRQIDSRYGQSGADADLAMQIGRAGRKILLVPGARVRHTGRTGYTTAERADFLLGRAVFLGKFEGTGAGIKARLSAVLWPLFGFRIGEFIKAISGQKIDGTQE